MLRIGPISLTAVGGFAFAVTVLDDEGDATVVALPGDEAIRDPGGGREGGGGFAVQSGHGVIVSISDNLRACQAAVFCFHCIGREPAVHPSSARASEDAPTGGKCPPPKARRWAGTWSVGAGSQAARREDPQGDAALTLRRRHGPACCFLQELAQRPQKSKSPRDSGR